MKPVASVSVDLDPIACYYRIHGLPPHPSLGRDGDGLADVVFRRALPRYLEILARHRIRATFFVVGADLVSPRARALVKELVAAGHEVGNHSHEHPYEMARLPRDRMASEIHRAHLAIAQAAGTPPVGFRAPGYDLSPAMLDELSALGYRYDSSIFPAPGYYAAKAAVMAMLAAVGRPSGAVMTNPRALLAPADPYRPDAAWPWRRGQSPLVELPIAVTPWLRLPAIGTNLLLFPAALRARWLEEMRGRRFFNLELHGIDLVDAEKDGIPSALVARQPDLRASLAVKQRAFEATLDRLAWDYEFATLGEVATKVQREGKI
jgi:hypothetical protein